MKTSKRKAVGAYYTRDDVTAYVAGAVLLPWLLDAAAQRRPAAFAPEGEVWQSLRHDPDRYLPAALRQAESLPGENRREHHARRDRYRELHARLRDGTANAVNDLVTLNIDLPQFVRDLITGCADREVLDAVGDAAATVTVLDPTCGDGAFLQAALRVLEEVAWACRQRGAVLDGRPSCVERVAIRRSILARSLHGVDLRADAVEQCRQNLLRTLADAQPSPDLGAAIHCGNALLGNVQPDSSRSARSGFHWWQRFPAAMRAGGFDVILGNPPYIAADRVGYAVPGFATANCPDVYAWVLERSAQLLRPGGRSGMVVPLSLGFSRDFDACRRALFAAYRTSWFASFGRIPSALFAFDIRVRNTIHLGHKADNGSVPQCYTTRLHRWYDEARPQLFALLEYTAFDPECWRGRVPKFGGAALCRALEDRLARTSVRLGDSLTRRPTPYALHYKKTAYNWLTFCRHQPPCYDALERQVAQTQFDTLYFAESWLRDAALLLLNGQWAYAFWSAVGDDFHVTRGTVADFPIDLAQVPRRDRPRLSRLARRLERAMRQATTFKRNAGKRVGSYNLARCRSITDASDRYIAEFLGLTDVWAEVETLCAHLVKTEYTSVDLGVGPASRAGPGVSGTGRYAGG